MPIALVIMTETTSRFNAWLVGYSEKSSQD